MSAFVLKIIACITMFIDHIGYVIFDGPSYFNYIGRIAFPIFAFQISQGYIYTHNIKKYVGRLFAFALISQIPFMLFYSIISTDFSLNVIFTLMFGLLCIIIYDKFNILLGIIATIILGLCSNFLHCDYGFYGVVIVFLFYVFRNSKTLFSSFFLIATLLNYVYYILKSSIYGLNIAISYYLPYMLSTFLSIIFIILYNKKKGPDTRYMLYLFYPLHMLGIYLFYLAC